MSNYGKLPDAEVNAKLAEKMGWKRSHLIPHQWVDASQPLDSRTLRSFSPCTSRDDLAVVVRHIRSDINMAWEFQSRLQNMANSSDDYAVFYYLACPPRIIAEACLEVLEE